MEYRLTAKNFRDLRLLSQKKIYMMLGYKQTYGNDMKSNTLGYLLISSPLDELFQLIIKPIEMGNLKHDLFNACGFNFLKFF